MADPQSAVDDATVSTSFQLLDASQNIVTGSIREAHDTFTFIPGTTPLADGSYTLRFTAADTAGNTQSHIISFSVGSTLPEKPTITGGTVNRRIIQPRPKSNITNQFVVQLDGTRQAQTAVWINSVKRIDLGDADWSVDVALQPGANTLEVWLVDQAGNQGPSEWVDIYVISSVGEVYEYDAAGRVRRIASTDE